MDELKNSLTDEYEQLEEIERMEDVKEGYLSNNYVLHTKNGRKYFLKQYRDVYTEEEIKDIHKVGRLFYNSGIPIILPILNRKNATYFILDNKRYSLFPFVEGVKVDRQNIPVETIKSIATTLANLHMISANGLPIQINHEDSFINIANFFNGSPEIFRIISSIKNKTEFDELSLKTLKLKESLLKENTELIESFRGVRDHLLHGDYHDKNIFLDENMYVKYVFDLEKTKIGDRLQELIRSMDYIFLNGNYTEKNIEKAQVYIRAYYHVYPFKKDDLINTLKGYWLKKATSLWIYRTHYIEGSNRVDCFLKNELALLEYFPKSYIDLADILMNNL